MLRRVLVLSLFAASATVQAQQQFAFKDWVVGCDNTRHCDAVGYQAEEQEPAVSLWLGRDGGGNAPLQAKLSAISGDRYPMLAVRFTKIAFVVSSAWYSTITGSSSARNFSHRFSQPGGKSAVAPPTVR